MAQNFFQMLALTVFISAVSLLAKYLLNNWTDFIETLQREAMDVHLQLIKFWNQPKTIWLPHSTEYKKHLNIDNLAEFTVLELKSGVVVATNDPQHIL